MIDQWYLTIKCWTKRSKKKDAQICDCDCPDLYMIVGTLITVLVSVIGLNKNVYKNRELFPLRPTT